MKSIITLISVLTISSIAQAQGKPSKPAQKPTTELTCRIKNANEAVCTDGEKVTVCRWMVDSVECK